jgi:hypothetical protein
MILKDYSDYSVDEPERQEDGVAIIPKGFTIQVENDKERQNVWNEIVKEFPLLNLEGQNQEKHLDKYNPDLIEIIVNQKLSAAEAWQKTYELRRLPGVAYAEPRFALLIPQDVCPEAIY